MPYENFGSETREIYRYDNGTRLVAADPAVIWRRINEEAARLGETWDAIAERCSRSMADLANLTDEERVSNERTWVALQGVMVAIARPAFRLAELDEDGNGVTEAHVMSVLGEFLEHREKKDESTATSPSGSGPTDGPPTDSSPASSAAPSTTKLTGAFR